MATRYYVLFRSSFRYDAAPNISHETIDMVRTLCGRSVEAAETLEPDSNDLEPDCRTCARAAARLRAEKRAASEEAQLRCTACGPGHAPGELRRPCRVRGCECWCSR